MNPAILRQPFFQVTLPLMVTFVAAIWIAPFGSHKWAQNKRFDDFKETTNRRFDEVIKRLDRIEAKLDDHEKRLTRVEERTSLIARS
jgi:hypothetical protein